VTPQPVVRRDPSPQATAFEFFPAVVVRITA
jgi:hypothetical protein